METITTQGVTIPRLGFGTFRMPGADAQPVVESAIALGYRHIDTATMYENEAAVGAAIAASGIARHKLFVTTKVWHDQLAPDALHRAFDASLRKLGLDHVDLYMVHWYMVHWPSRDMDMAATLEALTSLRERGLTRAIGVCNFNLPMLRRALEDIGAPIASVQLEYHPFLSQAPMLVYLREKGIPLTAYSPLAQGRGGQRSDACRARPQAWLQRRADRGLLAAGPAGRGSDPQSCTSREPEGQSRCALCPPRRR